MIAFWDKTKYKQTHTQNPYSPTPFAWVGSDFTILFQMAQFNSFEDANSDLPECRYSRRADIQAMHR